MYVYAMGVVVKRLWSAANNSSSDWRDL